MENQLVGDPIEDDVIHVSSIEETLTSNKTQSSGYMVLDEAMEGGFRDGNLIIITGRSGEGKTTFMQNLSINISNLSGSCQFFSYEITQQELKRKFMNMHPSDPINLNIYTARHMVTGNLEWIKEKIKEGMELYNVKYVFIDHIDFLTPTNLRDSDQIRSRLKQITTELKTLANEMSIVIFLIAHIKKVDASKEIRMEDIAESSGIYQLADYVFCVRRNFSESVDKQTGIVKKSDDSSFVNILKNRQSGNVTAILKYRIKNGRTVIGQLDGKDIHQTKFNPNKPTI